MNRERVCRYVRTRNLLDAICRGRERGGEGAGDWIARGACAGRVRGHGADVSGWRESRARQGNGARLGHPRREGEGELGDKRGTGKRKRAACVPASRVIGRARTTGKEVGWPDAEARGEREKGDDVGGPAGVGQG